jgi:hypothetical protein
MAIRAAQRTLGLAALAIGIGVGTLFSVAPADAAVLAHATQQGGGEQQASGGEGGGQAAAASTPLDQYAARVARIESLIQAGDCSAARSEVRAFMEQNPSSLFRSDATFSQIRELSNRMDDAMSRARNLC